MQITAEYLADLRRQAEAEKQRLIAQVNQTMGAIGMIDALLAKVAEPEPEKAED